MHWRWLLALIVVSLAVSRWYFNQQETSVAAGHTAQSVSAGDRYLEYPSGDGVVPASYPKDAPVFPEARIVSVVELPRPRWMHWNLAFEVDAPVAELDAWYRAQLARDGWTVRNVLALPAGDDSPSAGEALVATKGRRRLEVAWGNGEGPRRTVSQTLVQPE